MIDLRTALVIVHIIGTVLGAGGATVSDFLFFRFASKGHIEKEELRILKMVTELIWIGLFILLLTGAGFIAMYILNYGGLGGMYNIGKVSAKATIVAILIANGFVLHRVVMPLFEAQKGKPFATPEFIKKSPVIFAAGAVSFVSWYAAIILGGWRRLDAGYSTVMGVYLVILVLAVAVSVMGGWFALHHLRKRKPQG